MNTGKEDAASLPLDVDDRTGAIPGVHDEAQRCEVAARHLVCHVDQVMRQNLIHSCPSSPFFQTSFMRSYCPARGGLLQGAPVAASPASMRAVRLVQKSHSVSFRSR